MEHVLSQSSPIVKQQLLMIRKLQLFWLNAPCDLLQQRDANGESQQRLNTNQLLLPNGDIISCLLWRKLLYVTGSDLIKAIRYLFLVFGHRKDLSKKQSKKFVEDIFSDLRNLKEGDESTLEPAKSAFLDILYMQNCIKTRKKQKVFHWFSVCIGSLFYRAFVRDLNREGSQDEQSLAIAKHYSLYLMNSSLYSSSVPGLETDSSVICSLETNTREEGYQGKEIRYCLQSKYSSTFACNNSFALGNIATPLNSASERKGSAMLTGLDTVRQLQQSPTTIVSTELSPGPRGSFYARESESRCTSPPETMKKGSSISHAGTPNPTVECSTSQYNRSADSRGFSCFHPGCGRRFLRANHLKRHLVTHTKDKPYFCCNCDAAFARADNLRAHSQRKHR